MPNDQLNQYFENAIQEWAAEYLAEQMEAAAEREESEAQEIIDREIRWYDKQPDIERNGDTLLIRVKHPDGVVVWKILARDEEFVKNTLPVFAKRLEPTEPIEAAELRRLENKLSRDSWKLKPADRGTLEQDIEDAKAALERAKAREPVPRYGIYKTLHGRDVGVHRLYLRCGDDEQVAAFDDDMTNYCTVKVRCRVLHNFEFSEKQLANEVPKNIARQYEDRLVPNLYIVSSDSNPSKRRSQTDFERDGIVPKTDLENIWATPVRPNADLGTRAGTPYGTQDAGRFRPPTAKEIEEAGIDAIGQFDRHKPAPISARLRSAEEVIDRLLSGGEFRP